MIKLKLQEYSYFRTWNIIKQTPQQYKKSNNVAQYEDQHNVALRQQNHEKTRKKKTLSMWKSFIYILKEEKKRYRESDSRPKMN
jgi:hypothetical protein